MACELCDREVLAKGLCPTHYQRQLRHGGFENRQGQRPPIDPGPRFLAKIRVEDNGCWTWTGGISKHGYGKFKVNSRTVLAHRFAWFLEHGLIPEGDGFDHLCHTQDKTCVGGTACLHRRCVNPAHLEPVSAQENVRRRDTRK